MKNKFELGETVYVKAEIIRIAIDPEDRKRGIMYDVAVPIKAGHTLSLNWISEDDMERCGARMTVSADWLSEKR